MITSRWLNGRVGTADWVFVATVLCAALVIGACALLPAEDSPLRVSAYLVSLIGKYLCYALLALAIDLVWGFCGLLSLGHGAFFALGGYAMGMHLMRMIGDRGVYGDPLLPDFMVFLAWTELPWYWEGFDVFVFALLAALLVPGVVALVIGWFAFRSRVTGVYFSIVTQALTYALMLAFFQNDLGFGGNNGLTDFKDLLGASLTADGTRVALLFASALALAGCFLTCRWMVTSKLGRVLVAVRDAEPRLRFLGYRSERFKLFVWTISAMMAGLAGALYVPQVGIINPGEFAPAKSIEAVVWVAVGGRGFLLGAPIGAVIVGGVKTLFTGLMADAWLFVLGGLFIAVTLFLPRGVWGALAERFRRRSRGEDAGS